LNEDVFGTTASIPENDKEDSPPKLGEDRMLPKMRKQWTHREIEAMKEAVAGDCEVVMELEEPLGMVGLGIRLEKNFGIDQLGMFFLFLLHHLRSRTHMSCCR
jgi:hypothetical protein